jgi:hypothetical protein
MPSEKREFFHIDIPAKLDIDQVVRRSRLRNNNTRLEDITRELAEKAAAIARPKAIYQVSPASILDSTTVAVNGVVFTSKILSKLFANLETVYPFVTTIGHELDELPIPSRDMLRNFSLDAIKTVVLVNAVDYLAEYLKKKYDIPYAALMNPGEIQDWPITQQKPLFELFGTEAQKIGVSLTTGGAMKPIKSRSGIIFPNDTGFLSCRFCTQFRCPGRRAAYDPQLVKEYLGTEANSS